MSYLLAINVIPLVIACAALIQSLRGRTKSAFWLSTIAIVLALTVIAYQSRI